MIGLDIETAPDNGAPQEYALQPWRVKEGTAKITAMSLARSDGQAMLVADRTDDLFLGGRKYQSILDHARDTHEAICTWNGIFDVAFLIAAGHDISNIKWLDVMLLWKWYSNSQRMEWLPAWSLADGAKRWLKDWPHLEKFLEMKSEDIEAGENDEYWELRCKMDSLVTVMIAEKVWAKLTPQQQRSAMITMQCIVPTANSWVNGVRLNFGIMSEMLPSVTQEMFELECKLGISNEPHACEGTIVGGKWVPSKILRSPKQMGQLLYDTWGLECTMFTPKIDTAVTEAEKKKARATNKAALTYLADHDDRVLDILRWRELNTQLTKFIESPAKAKEYLNSETMHPSPRLFSTYTGRMTYQSKTKKKFFTGVALHQWPRNKKLRGLIHV
jgi:DNA polymerase I-like protein with 3'-5' exonuclease and polymerase domains